MTKLTLPWTRQGRFLRALAKTANVAAACRAAGLDRRLAYRWRDSHPAFARRWKEVAAQAVDLVRGELMERALLGRERIVYRYRPTVAHRQVRRELFGSVPKSESRPGTRIPKSDVVNSVAGAPSIRTSPQRLDAERGTPARNKQAPFR
jgi:hypothetical protein